MIACADVHYRGRGATAACVLFQAWPDSEPVSEIVTEIARVEPYVPGRFFRRELPCLLVVLRGLDELPGAIIIDGYVWLGDERHPGLGAYLYEALGRQAAVIGVAKSVFHGAELARPVVRGGSISPLYVSAAGMNLSEAARCIQTMHGKFRIPTLIKRADHLSRGFVCSIRNSSNNSDVIPADPSVAGESRNPGFVPAKAGNNKDLDSRFHGNDRIGGFPPEPSFDSDRGEE